MYKCQKKYGTTANTTTHNSKLVEMPKLNFRYGVMNSAKTAELLMMVHNMESKGKAVVVIKPGVDTRNACIQSRLGMTRVPDIVALEDSDVHAIVMLMMAVSPNVSAVFVDEAQFLTAAHVEQLRELSIEVNVFCYGLRTDYRGVLFAGSKRLMELADTVEEVRSPCKFCERKAIMTAKFCDDRIIRDGGGGVDVGAEEKYMAMCWKCWYASAQFQTITMFDAFARNHALNNARNNHIQETG